MYGLKVNHYFDSAHFLKDYDGKCSNIHGHRWRVIAEVCAEELVTEGQVRGMVVDFDVLKRDLKETVDLFDHALIIERDSMREATYNHLKEDGFKIIEVDFRPTAECFAKFFFDKMKKKGYGIKRITVYETENNCAVYEEN